MKILIIITVFIFINTNAFSQNIDISDIEFENKNIFEDRIFIHLPKSVKTLNTRILNPYSSYFTFTEKKDHSEFISFIIKEEYTLFPSAIDSVFINDKYNISTISKIDGREFIKVTPIKYLCVDNSTFIQKTYFKNFDGTVLSICININKEITDSLSYYKQIADSVVNSYKYGTRSIININKYTFSLNKDSFCIKVPDNYVRTRRKPCSYCKREIKIQPIDNFIDSNNYISIWLSYDPICYGFTNLHSGKMYYNNVIKGKLNWHKINHRKIIWGDLKETTEHKMYQEETIFMLDRKNRIIFKINIVSNDIKKYRQMKKIVKSMNEI